MTRQELADKYGEDLLFADGFDECIIGIVTSCGRDDVVAYDGEKVIQNLMRNGIPNRDEAEDYFDYNVRGAYVGTKTPVFILT